MNQTCPVCGYEVDQEWIENARKAAPYEWDDDEKMSFYHTSCALSQEYVAPEEEAELDAAHQCYWMESL